MGLRRVRVLALFEWMAAALGAIGVIWVLSGPVQQLSGLKVPGPIAQDDGEIPPGVPPGATRVPIMLMLDGREIRLGDLRSRVEEILPAALAAAPAHVSRARFGDRHARVYVVDGVTVYVVCERIEPNGPMKITGIYLP